jgi:hypothetical protein
LNYAIYSLSYSLTYEWQGLFPFDLIFFYYFGMGSIFIFSMTKD